MTGRSSTGSICARSQPIGCSGAPNDAYEVVAAVLSDDGGSLLTRRETRVDPPNYYVRDTADSRIRAITSFENPAPQLTGIEKTLVTYQRADGVQLSGTLYVPPGDREGQRVPMVMWAYPREFVDPQLAGQVSGSDSRFTAIRGPSHLLLLTQGFAIFDGPTMPIIGPGETANDTYVEQLVASAQAAVDRGGRPWGSPTATRSASEATATARS